MRRAGVAVLGSTGSIGSAALRVLGRQHERFQVRALTAHNNEALLREQQRHFDPEFVGIVCANGATPPGWMLGEGCLTAAAQLESVDVVLNAVVGSAGLEATIAALAGGKRVALANKESLVAAGELVNAAARSGGGEIVPVDSEHSAILQCLAGRSAAEIRRLIITASGGPFRELSAAGLATVTVSDALRHPTWQMGRKITVDSATLANKALEVIEAHFLFGVPYDNIEVIVHPQSIVHSMVEFIDGSVMAQLGAPSMELPILYSLTHPERVSDSGGERFDAVRHSPLTFEPVRVEDFPALRLGLQAGRAGGVAPAVFNAANEQAVALFLSERIGFQDIARAIEAALGKLDCSVPVSLESVLRADRAARSHVSSQFG